MSWTISGTEKTPVDPVFNNVSLLLHGNGANGSTTITDSSPLTNTVTAVGDAKISTAQSKFGGSSIAFDGTGDYLSIPDSIAFTYSANNFTIEFFYRFNSAPGSGAYQFLYSQRNSGADYFFIYFDQATIIFDSYFPPLIQGPQIFASTTHVANTWKHLALVRNGSSFTFYLDGISIGTTTSTATFPDIAAPLDLGRWSGGSGREFNGYIDDLRITKGIARYTSNFTPPTAPFPDI